MFKFFRRTLSPKYYAIKLLQIRMFQLPKKEQIIKLPTLKFAATNRAGALRGGAKRWK